MTAEIQQSYLKPITGISEGKKDRHGV